MPFFIEAFLGTQPMVKKISLPHNVDLARKQCLPVSDNFPHLPISGEGHEKMHMI